jgi:hypothetical protein
VLHTIDRSSIMIDIWAEKVIDLSEASEIIPGNPSKQSLYVWTTQGVRGTVLETIQIGARRFTSREAIGRFVAALSDPAKVAEVRANTPALRSPREQKKAARKAGERLKEAGA